MSTVLDHPDPKTASWPISSPRPAALTLLQVAAALAAGASAAPELVQKFSAELPTGEIVTVYPDGNGDFDENNPLFEVTLTPAAIHASIGRILTAHDRVHTDLGNGYLVPSFTPFPMSDREVCRWLADLGTDMAKPCSGCGCVFCTCPRRDW